MKYFIILFGFLILVGFTGIAFATHDPTYNHPTPFPFHNLSPKVQLSMGIEPENVQCKYGFEFVQKYDDSPACVKYETKIKLIQRGWTNINLDRPDILYVFEVVKDDTTFDVEYSIKGGSITDVLYDVDANSLIITIDATGELNLAIDPNDDNNLTLSIPRDLMDAKFGYCPFSSDAPDDRFFILLDGEEVLYDEIMTTDNERTLQILFREETVKIEIIVTCLV